MKGDLTGFLLWLEVIIERMKGDLAGLSIGLKVNNRKIEGYAHLLRSHQEQNYPKEPTG